MISYTTLLTSSKMAVARLVFVCLFGLGTAFADGHCNFQQYSPRLKRWFEMCQMPATPATCEKLAATPGKGEGKFAEGPCDSKAMTGGCVVNGAKLFFYAGTGREIAKGCEFLGGNWQTNLTPGP